MTISLVFFILFIYHVLYGMRTGIVLLIFSFSLRPVFVFEVSNVEGLSLGGLVTHNLSSLPGLAFFFVIS